VTRAALRPRAALGALLMCAMMLPLLSGCTLFNRVFHRGGKTASCHERPFAGNADSRPPLKVPPGMSAPDTRNAVKIPELAAADRERPKTEPCLAQPPKFFAKPPAAGKPVDTSPRAAPENGTAPQAAPAPAAPPPVAPPAQSSPPAPVAVPDVVPPG
jgi:hypothetical protein